MFRLDYWHTVIPYIGVRKLVIMLQTEQISSIVGWNLSETLDTSSVMQAVKEAVETHENQKLSTLTKGSQFTSNEYKNMLKDLKITQSMGEKGNYHGELD